MDFAVVGKVLLILAAIPIVFLVWGLVFVLVDDTFCDGVFQDRIKRWAERKWRARTNE